MDWRASLLSCLALASLACPDFEPPPDIDSGTSEAEGEADPEDLEVVYDGDGIGLMFPARLRDVPEIALDPSSRYGLLVGAPLETWEDIMQAGQVSLLIDGDAGLAPPLASPSTYVEDSARPTVRLGSSART